MKIFNTDSLNIADLKNTVQDYLTSLYSNSKNIYKSSSPFGQILNVINEYFKLLMLYLEDAVTENNILTANKQNSIHGLSRISGHNPTRALSAQGNIKIKISKSILGEISASYITIADGSRIKCLDNNQTYFIQLGNALENLMKDFSGTIDAGELCVLEKSNNRMISLANTAIWSTNK